MTWTYILANPLSTKDYVRLLIGDTQPYAQQLQDEEILSVLADESDPVRAAVTCAETLAAFYARYVAEGNRPGASDLLAHYQQLALRLRRKMARSGVGPFVGGQSLSTKQQQQFNTDQVQPAFVSGQFTHPGTEDVSPTLLPQQSAY